MEKADRDITEAQKRGLINNLSKTQRADLLNIVMFGGNGNESEEIKDMGKKIIDNITGHPRNKRKRNESHKPYSKKRYKKKLKELFKKKGQG